MPRCMCEGETFPSILQLVMPCECSPLSHHNLEINPTILQGFFEIIPSFVQYSPRKSTRNVNADDITGLKQLAQHTATMSDSREQEFALSL